MAIANGLFTDWRAILICLFSSLGALQFGYDSSYFSGILVMEQFVQYYGTYDPVTNAMVVSASRQSLVTSIINVGEFLGALTSFWVGERFGMKGGLYVACIVVLLGTTLQISGTEIGLMIAGRLVVGYAVGLISCFVPLYIADCAPAKVRGAMVSMYQFMIGIGLILGVCVDYATAKRTDTGSFRIPIAVQYVFPLILSSGLLLFCPESPRWLAAKGRSDACEKSLRRLRGPHVDISEDLQQIRQIVQQDSIARESSSWSSIMKVPAERRKAYLGWALQALQQGTGINFITGYGVYFFTVIGIENPFLIQLALYLVGIPALWTSQVGIEKLGRCPMLFISGILMAGAILGMGGLGLNANPTYSISQGIVALVFIYIITFNLAWGPTVWVICSEISTGLNRSRLMSISTCGNWFFTWLVSFTFPYLFNADAANLSAKIGFIYGPLTLLAVIWVYFMLPETAQRSLEDINALFEQNVSARKFSSAHMEQSPTNEKMEPEPIVVRVVEHTA